MPRLGVFVCHCGKNIAGGVDVKELVQFARAQHDVVFAKDHTFLCSEQGQELITKAIQKHGLERIVVAACGPELHAETFKRVLENSGIEPEYLVMAHIRKFTMGQKTDKADPGKVLQSCQNELGRTVKRLRLKKIPKKVEVQLNQNILVLGAGIAGIDASLELAKKGYKVYLVEHKPVIGGAMALLYKVYPTDDCASCILAPKLAQVMNNTNIEVLTQTEITGFSGYIGNFDITLNQQPFYINHSACTGCGACVKVCPEEVIDHEYQYGLGNRKAIYLPYPQAVPHKAILDMDNCSRCGKCLDACNQDAIVLNSTSSEYSVKVGALIITTGFSEFNPNSIQALGYQEHSDIITQRQLIRLLDINGPTKGQLLKPSNGKVPKNIVMLQCVGSRDNTTNISCSGGVCCMAALKHSQLIKAEYPDINVYISMLDMRAYGKGFEEYYQQAMNSDVKFIRGRFAEISGHSDKLSDKLKITIEDLALNQLVEISADLIILSTAMVPAPETGKVAKLFGTKLGDDGFFTEAHMKLRPVETNIRGIYIAGSCRGPTDIPTSIIQAKAAASEVDTELRKEKIKLPEAMVKN